MESQTGNSAEQRAPGTTAARGPLVSWRLVVVCLFFFLLDGLVTGLPSIGLLCCVAAVLLGAISAVHHLARSEKRIAAQRVLHAAICAVAIAAILGAFALNRRVGHSNAEAIIAAVERYKSDQGAYPQGLDDLVPRYIEAVPACAYRLFATEYHFLTSHGEHPMLMWVELPPFGRPTYDFGTGEWGYLD